MENIRVFKMNDYEWWASKWDMKRTNEWYKKEHGLSEEDNPLEDIRECNLDTEGMWWETEDKEDIERLGDHDEIISIEKINGMTKTKATFGNLQRKYGEVYKFISLREAVEKDMNFKVPYCIGSTEW